MFGSSHRRSRPMFLWIALVTTTILLVLVVYVQVNNPVEDENRTVTSIEFAPNNLEQEYAQDVRTRVQTYVEALQTLEAEDQDAQWLALAQELHNALLQTLVPERMQSIHLSLVLELSQTINQLENGNIDMRGSHMEELDLVVSSLSYE